MVCLEVGGRLRQAKEEPILLAGGSLSPVPSRFNRSHGSRKEQTERCRRDRARLGSGQGAGLTLCM